VARLIGVLALARTLLIAIGTAKVNFMGKEVMPNGEGKHEENKLKLLQKKEDTKSSNNSLS
jgi:hypothetical protein